MQISQLVLDLWQNLSSSVSTLEMLSTIFLLTCARGLVTIFKYLCRILQLLKNFSAALLNAVKRKLNRQQLPEQRRAQLLEELAQLEESLSIPQQEVNNNVAGVFKIQR